MRAFMSSDTIGGPVDELDAPETIAAACELAEREARAILAVTEPDIRDAQGWPLTTWQPSLFLNQRTLAHMTALSAAQGSLAEALAAFVEG